MATIALSDTTIGRPSNRSNYSAGNFPDQASALESRRSVKLNPVSGSEFAPREKIRFYVPQGTHEVCDFLNSYVRFRAKDVTTPASKEPSVLLDPVGAAAFIRRVTIRNNGVVLEDMQYANRFAGLNVKAAGIDYNKTMGRAHGTYIKRQAGPQESSDIDAMNAKHLLSHYEYIYPMSELCLLNHELYMPLMYMGNSGIALDIEFELEIAASCLSRASNGTTTYAVGTYTLYEVELVMELVAMRNDWVAQGWAHLAEGRNIELPMVCWDLNRQPVSSTASIDVIRFSNFNQSVKSIFALFVKSSEIDLGSRYAEYFDWEYPSLESYQFRINVDLKPEQEIITHNGTDESGNNRAIVEVFKALRQFKDFQRSNSFEVWGNHQYGNATAGRLKDFLIGLPLDVHILGDDDRLVSGLNLRERAAPLEMVLKKTATGTAYNTYICMQYDAKLVINRGEVAVYK
jgi:hypothetical protein